MITQERLKEVLHYDPGTGIFTNKITRGSRSVLGSEPGCICTDTGYIVMNVDYCKYSAHRLAFLYMNGELPKIQTDHINGVRSDNRWDNLREVTASENQQNQRKSKRNKSGFTGVSWDKQTSKWHAQIMAGNKVIHLGHFDEKKDAIKARAAANIKYGFHPNHGN